MQRRSCLIVCEIFFREICALLSSSEEVFDVIFMPKGLHDLGGEKMRQILQSEIDKVDEKKYRNIVLGYALCNNGIVGLKAGNIPIVVPKAHDCITLFLGSRKRYKEYFFNNTGTYFHTTGWIERGGEETRQLGPKEVANLPLTLEDYVKQYGEENGRYLWEMLDPGKNYKKIAYISLDLGEAPDYRKFSKKMADKKKWEWEELKGDSNILRKLIDDNYDKDFLIVQPGKEIVPTNDDEVIGVR